MKTIVSPGRLDDLDDEPVRRAVPDVAPQVRQPGAWRRRHRGGAAPGRPPGATRSPGWLVLVLLAESLVAFDVRVPWLRPLVGLFAVAAVPVVVLTRRTFARVEERLVALLYACGVTVLGIIGVGLALNTALPHLGVARPLDRPTLVVASTLIDLVLVSRLSPRPLLPLSAVRAAPGAVLRARLEPAVVLAVVAVVLAVAGAVRLNNRLGGETAAIAHAVEAVALGTAMLRRGSGRRNAVVLYLVSVALLLGTSMRGWYITGHDIQNEYLAFLYTHHAGHWVMSTYPQPYNACLSVNILPNVLVNVLGVGGVFVFKIVMQLLFALVPVCVYASARRLLSGRKALLAGTMFVFFPTFFTDMPYLVRQEVAYLFVGLLVLAAFQPGWTTRARQFACLAFGLGVVLSHYSTTYVLIITLLLGFAATVAGTVYQRIRIRRDGSSRARHRLDLLIVSRKTASQAVLAPLVIVGIMAGAWLWSSPATHSDGHLSDTVSQLTESLIKGNSLAGSSDVKYSLLTGGGPTPQQRLDLYVDVARLARATGPVHDYAFPDTTGTPATVVERPYLPLTTAGRAVQSAGLDVHTTNSVLKTSAAVLFQLMLAAGVLALMLRARSTRRIGREQFWLMLAGIAALGAVVVVPGLSADYGVLRAFQQTLLFAAPLLAVGVTAGLSRLGRAAFPVAVALTLGIGLVLTGALPAVVGGYYAQLSQSNSGQYYNLLYVRSPELSAARWLAGATRGQGPTTVTASDIVSVTRLQSLLPRSVGVSGDYLPLQLRTGAYVFMGPQTATHGQATIFYTGDLITYSYPTATVVGKLNLLYSSPGTRIYR